MAAVIALTQVTLLIVEGSVEGMPTWLMPAVLSIFALMALSGLPALVAIGFLIARRPRTALVWFAAALLCEAILGGVFCAVLTLHFDVPSILALLTFVIAGVGQFIAACRGPASYAVALPFALAAVAGIVLGLPSEYHSRLPDWDAMPMIVASLAMAMASVTVAVLVSKAGRGQPSRTRLLSSTRSPSSASSSAEQTAPGRGADSP